MEQELKDLKSVLRSLVVSSPTQVDMRSLLRDYRNMMGAPIPLAKYGYKEPMLFLKERCSDCFVFQGPASNPILTLIVPETLKHIDQFVQKQKLSSTSKFKGKRRSIPGELIKKSQSNLIVSTFRPAPTSSNKPKQQDPIKTSQQSSSSNSNNLEHKLIKKASNSTLPISKSVANIRISDKVNEQQNSTKQSNTVKEESCSSDALQKFLKKRLPVYDSSSCIEDDEEVASNSGKTSSRDDADSGRLTLSSGSSAKTAKLEALRNEILDLIAEHPEGVWCTDLMRLYKARYGRELDFSRLGHSSVLSLVLALEGVRAAAADSGNWLLSLASAPPPPRPRPPPPRARRAPAAPPDPDDALPGIDYDPEVFPADCVHFAESIPGAELAGAAPPALLEVMVGEVYSPSHFWLLRLGPDHYEAMCDVMDEMTKYYTYGAGRERALAAGAVRVGHYCSSVYERDWHRSLIVRILDSDTVKVRHVDYGTVETVKVSALKPLLRRWAALPAQALRARLAGVRPPARGRRWPHAASAHFLRLVADKRLVADVVGLDPEEDILEVFLVNTLSEEDVYVDKEMVRSGHADARADAPQTAECYLFPRFDALENGQTPNFADIYGYLRDGIALEFVDEYRRHVPSCLPPLPAAEPAPAPARSLPLQPRPTSSSSQSDESLRPDSDSPPDRIRASAPEFVPSAKAAPREAAEPPRPAELFNRVPLMRPPMPTGAPPPFRAPGPPPPYPAMMPMHPCAGYPPFPGAVPFYPPPMPVFVAGPPGLVPPGLGPPGPPDFHGYPVGPSPPVSRAPGNFPRAGGPSIPPARPPPAPGPPADVSRPPAAGAVTLSVSDCQVFKVLSSVNPGMAQQFMADAISRAMGAGAGAGAGAGCVQTSSLNPEAAEFRLVAAGTQTEPAMLPFKIQPLPPGMRPPPGFGG